MSHSQSKATLHTDGGSRGNPGPAAIGYVITIAKKKIMHGEYIGETTNNQAEYQALVAGVKRAIKEGITDLMCYLDSELVVKQIRGEYRVRDKDLRPHFESVQKLMHEFIKITFQHIPRAKNKEADMLVNNALDQLRP